jgi:hypothetical protein
MKVGLVIPQFGINANKENLNIVNLSIMHYK